MLLAVKDVYRICRLYDRTISAGKILRRDPKGEGTTEHVEKEKRYCFLCLSRGSVLFKMTTVCIAAVVVKSQFWTMQSYLKVIKSCLDGNRHHCQSGGNCSLLSFLQRKKEKQKKGSEKRKQRKKVVKEP